LRCNKEKLFQFFASLRKNKNRESKIPNEYDWKKLARKNQLEPEGNWTTWLILAGRGFGKTRTGAETIREWADSGRAKRIALIGETEREVRQVMIEGESGLLNIGDPKRRPKFNKSQMTLKWQNGSKATGYTAEAYEKLRGPQFDGAWVDELAKFPNAKKVWDQLMFCLRLGQKPKAIVTTTPRPVDIIQALVKDSSTYVTRGSTYDNWANLSKSYIEYIKRQYEGTRLGAQEIYAEILSQTQDALWTRSIIQYAKEGISKNKFFKRIVIGVDPAVSNNEDSDETGIIVAGLGRDDKGYVLEDLSGKYSPAEWAKKVVAVYHSYKADRVVAEVNQGGDLVEQTIRAYDSAICYKPVRACRGKITRAEPIAGLYEQGKVLHMQHFSTLENQMCQFTGEKKDKSPDRVDALVWALTDLMLRKTFLQKIKPKIWGV
jgi:predicted phage terminase large subunit-like protein